MEKIKLNVILDYRLANKGKILEINCDNMEELELEKASIFVDLNYCLRKYKSYKGFVNGFTKMRFNEKLYNLDCWFIFKTIDSKGDTIESAYLDESIWEVMRFGAKMGCNYGEII